MNVCEVVLIYKKILHPKLNKFATNFENITKRLHNIPKRPLHYNHESTSKWGNNNWYILIIFSPPAKRRTPTAFKTDQSRKRKGISDISIIIAFPFITQQ